jgi:hypothetical protein
MGFIAGAAVAALGSMGSAYLTWDAQDSALDAQEAALKKLKTIDIDEMKDLASETDIDRFRKQFEVQRDIDPRFAALRDKGAGNLLRALSDDASGQQYSDTTLKALGEDLEAERPVTQRLIDQLIERAEADLSAGATLPPEFQGELIKAGLERAGARGEAIDGRGVAGTEIRRLLGSEGLALKERREAGALAKVGAAENLRARRSQVLSELAQLDNNLRGAKVNRAAGAIATGSAAVPAVGLTGADAVNMSLSNLDLKNQVTLGLGNIKAQKRLAEGQMYSSMLSSGTNFIGGLMGGGGGMGGMLGGSGTQAPMGNASAGGNYGSWIGGILNQQPTGGYAGTSGGYQTTNRFQNLW